MKYNEIKTPANLEMFAKENNINLDDLKEFRLLSLNIQNNQDLYELLTKEEKLKLGNEL